jgi:DNA-directed RNA polymerase specialized sigma24 family protein
VDEEVNDNLLELDEMILGQYTVNQQDKEEDDDTAEPLPQIPPADALECLYKLRLYEEQQVDADKALIKTFMQYERVILKRKIESLRQGDIRQLFG